MQNAHNYTWFLIIFGSALSAEPFLFFEMVRVCFALSYRQGFLLYLGYIAVLVSSKVQ
jgi:hypothetical protein